MAKRDNVHKLEKTTQLNYEAAARYYAQKKMNFLKLAKLKEKKLEEEEEKNFFENLSKAIPLVIQNIIIKSWQKIYQDVIGALEISGREEGFKYKIANPYNFTRMSSIPEEIKEKIIKGEEKANLYSLLGFEYEKFLEDKIKEVAIELGEGKVEEIFNEFRSSGASKSVSALRTNYVDIRSDLAMNIQEKAGEDKILRDKSNNLPVELQQEFDITKYRTSNKEKDFTDTVLNDYLKSNMFGLSVKLWNKRVGLQEYTQSASLQQKINNVYNNRNTWNRTYAVYKANEMVSKYLIDIIGPINIAVITGQEFTWMDEFINNNLFSMNVYAKEGKEYKNNEIKPEIKDNKIYVRKYNIRGSLESGKRIVSSTSISKSKENKYRVTVRTTKVRK